MLFGGANPKSAQTLLAFLPFCFQEGLKGSQCSWSSKFLAYFRVICFLVFYINLQRVAQPGSLCFTLLETMLQQGFRQPNGPARCWNVHSAGRSDVLLAPVTRKLGQRAAGVIHRPEGRFSHLQHMCSWWSRWEKVGWVSLWARRGQNERGWLPAALEYTHILNSLLSPFPSAFLSLVLHQQNSWHRSKKAHSGS